MSFVKGMTRYLKLSSGFEFVGLFFSFTLLRSLITSLLPHFLFIVPMCRHYLTWIPFQSFLSSPALYLTSQVALPLTLNFLLSFPPSSSAYCIPFFYFCRSILGIIIFQINTSAIRTPQCVAWDCGWKDEEGDKQLEEDERVWVKKKKKEYWKMSSGCDGSPHWLRYTPGTLDINRYSCRTKWKCIEIHRHTQGEKTYTCKCLYTVDTYR